MDIIKTKVLFALVSLLFIAGGCTAANQDHDSSSKVLKPTEAKECKYGFIRPPGVNKCLNIDDIVANKIRMKAPEGRCPKNWERQSRKGFCLPENQIVSCTANDFRCGTQRSDTVRIVKGTPKCKLGSILIAVDFPQFNPSGTLVIDTPVCLVCGPVERIPPV